MSYPKVSSTTQSTKENHGEIRTLRCSCCGESTQGRQWKYRDYGYGLCSKCVTYIKNHKPFGQPAMSESEFIECYGIEGIHYNV